MDNPLNLLISLLLKSKAHLDYPFWVIQVNFLLSLQGRNFRIYLLDGEVKGFVNWTFLTRDDINLLISRGGVMRPELWRTDKTTDSFLFIPEIVVVDNMFSVVQADLERLFPCEEFCYGISWGGVSGPRLRKIKNGVLRSGRANLSQ